MLGIAVQVVSVPIVWNTIGGVKFGACLFLMALARWVGLIDFGILDGSQRRMTLAFDSGDDAKGFSTWNTYRAVLCFNAFLGAGLFVLLSQFVHIPELGNGPAWRGLFVASGALFAAQYSYMGVSTYFNARRQFGRLAFSNGAQSLLSGLLALGLTLKLRTPEAYLAGFAAGNLAVVAYNLGTIRRQAAGVSPKFFDKEVFDYTIRFGLKLFPTRVATVTTQTFDRIIITNVLGSSAMAPYGVASRLPEAAQEALPLGLTLMPDLTRAHSEGERQFADAVDRTTRISLMVGCGLILVPCTFADPVLRVWLGSSYVPEMAVVMVAIGAYRALEMFYSSLALTMIAHGSPQRVFPFTLYNAAMLLVFVHTAAVWYGIVGVAVLRVTIHAIQFVPLVSFTRKWVVPGLDLRQWMGRLLGTLGVAAALGALGVLSWSIPGVQSSPWLAFLLAPASMLVFFVIVDRLGFAEVPDGVRRRAGSGVKSVGAIMKRLVGKRAWRRLKVALGREVDVHLDAFVTTERFGNDYGGWNVATNEVNKNSIVYSFGVGGDVSFDVALIERFGATIHAFDPTPQCIEWVKEQVLPREFVMHAYGIADFDGNVTFSPPDDPTHVSHTILSRPSTADRAISVPVKRLATIMEELGHRQIDLMKMDVEGAEYSVIEDMVSSRILPRQLLVEFHHRFEGVGIKRTDEALKALRSVGYRLVSVSDSGEEYGFVLG